MSYIAMTRALLKVFLAFSFLFVLPLPLLASPTLSAGMGGGMGDENVGPFVVSLKYWSNSWEAGGEIFYDGDKKDMIDQFGFAWLAWRFVLHPEERNTLYMGVGLGHLFESTLYENNSGGMLLIGWDGKNYGLEGKYAWFDPSIYSVVAYYHF